MKPQEICNVSSCSSLVSDAPLFHAPFCCISIPLISKCCQRGPENVRKTNSSSLTKIMQMMPVSYQSLHPSPMHKLFAEQRMQEWRNPDQSPQKGEYFLNLEILTFPKLPNCEWWIDQTKFQSIVTSVQEETDWSGTIVWAIVKSPCQISWTKLQTMAMMTTTMLMSMSMSRRRVRRN